jgi:hypothetical protein
MLFSKSSLSTFYNMSASLRHSSKPSSKSTDAHKFVKCPLPGDWALNMRSSCPDDGGEYASKERGRGR